MLLIEEFNDLQYNASRITRVGAIPLISSRDLQLNKGTSLRRQHSSRHSRRILKLLPLWSNSSSLSDQVRTIGKYSNKLLFSCWIKILFTFEDHVDELGFGINRRLLLKQILDNFDILEMKLGKLNIPRPSIDILVSPVRF